MKKILILMMAMGLTFCCVAPQGWAKRHEDVTKEVIEKGDYKLVTTIWNKGTRSEGRHGDLYHKGKAVPGEEGDTLETDLGMVEYLKDFENRLYLWDYSGWKLK